MGKKQKGNKKNRQSVQLSRKQKRKQLRKDKKQKRKQFYEHKNLNTGYGNNRNIVNNSNKHGTGKSLQKRQNQSNKVFSNSNLSKTSNNNSFPKQLSLNHSINSKQPIKSQKKTHLSSSNSKPSDVSKPSSIKPKKQKKSIQFDQNAAQILKQQKQIQYYEKLLGVNKTKKKYKSIAKGLGYEDDLFDFLDNIGKNIKSNKKSYNKYEQDNNEQDQDQAEQVNIGDDSDGGNNHYDYDNDNEQEDEEMMDQQDERQQFQGMEEDQHYQQGQQQQQEGQQYDENDQDNIDQEENQYDDENQPEDILDQSEQNQDQSEQNQEQIMNNDKNNNKQKNVQRQKVSQEPTRPRLFGNLTAADKQKLQIRKQMTGLLNKISDGNLMITFRQFSQIFLQYPKSSTIPEFINLFIKFNVEVQKPHLHILLSNIALASAAHHLMGNRLMAPLVFDLVKKFQQFENTPQCLEEIQQIGYSRLFEKKKNIIIILCYLYDFKSLTGQFISSLVQRLAKVLNQHHIQFLYIIIQKIGNKIRQNDPGILKNIIDVLKQSIQNFKTQHSKKPNSTQPNESKTKIDIIQIQLNQLKLNKKAILFNDQRMAFFSTFIQKNVPKELNTQKQILLLNYEQIRQANTERTNWWENVEFKSGKNNNNQFQEDEEQNQEQMEFISELTEERKQLIELAKSLNLVTQIRKNIFIQIMEASDYIEATQRVLALKIKNLQQIAIVLVHVCVLQPTFNPYYPLVASKISNILPKFKSKIQFTIWDQIKLLDSFNPRKISNLAKFTARFISNPISNGSLTILKYFVDLINVNPFESMFLMIFFTQFFTIIKKQTLVKISTKLKEQSNKQIKQAILQYFSQVGTRQKGFNNMEKMKFLRRMIMLNTQEQGQEQRY